MTLDKHLFDRLQCPKCLAAAFEERDTELICRKCEAQFPVRGEIPVFVDNSAAPKGEFDYLAHYAKDAEVFDYFEERHGATEHAERRLREHLIGELPGRFDSVLDVGCGSAWLAKALMPRAPFLCSFDATIVNTSRAIEKYRWPGHTAAVGDAFHLPFKDSSFDVLMASEIIEHVIDPIGFVREMLRVLSPGGVLLISTPYKEVLKYTLCIHCNHQTPLNAHIHSFDENSLRTIVKQAGSDKMEWKTFGNKALSHLRTYVALRYLPHQGWRAVDAMANLLVDRPAHIALKIRK